MWSFENPPKKTLRTGSLLAVTVLAMTGCATSQVSQNNNAAVLDSGYEGAVNLYRDSSGDLNVDKNNLHQLLVAGKALHDAGSWAQSNELFSMAAQKLMWKEDTIDTPEEVLRFIGTTVTSDSLADYTGKIYEGLMLDYYMALNFLMLGDEDSARVKFNQLAQRQGNAEIQLQSYARSLLGAETEVENEENRKAVESTLSKEQSSLAQGMINVSQDVVNAHIRSPSGDLANAIFRETSAADTDKRRKAGGNLISTKHWLAVGILQSAAPDASARRFAGNLDSLLRETDDDLVFVIYEDGTGPSIDEWRIDLPIALVSDDLLYAGVALPKFHEGVSNNSTIGIRQGDQVVSTELVTDVNRLAALEFGAAYDTIVKKEVASVIVKTIAQVVANKAIDKEAGNPLGAMMAKIAVAGAAVALTSADTRHWGNLPNQIQMGVLEKKGSGNIVVTSSTGEEWVSVPNIRGNQLVYVRQQSANGDLKVFTQKLPATQGAQSVKSS